MKTFANDLLMMVMVLGLVACRAGDPPMPTSTAVLPTGTMSSVLTLTPTPTETPAPSPTATSRSSLSPTLPPTSTATPVPTSLPSPSPTPFPSVAPDLVDLLGSQPTLLYRQEEVLYAWDQGAERGYRLMDLSHKAGHLALSPTGYLAYTLDGVSYLADLSTGVIHQIYEDQDHPYPDWDLFWSTDGRALAYALAWNEPDGSRTVELGTHDGDERHVVAIVTARSGPVPTPPSKPPTPSHPGFAILAVLGYDRVTGYILVTPAGGGERHSAVWGFDTGTGQQTTLLAFDDPGTVEGLVASPDLAYLAVRLTPARIVVYDLAALQTAPRTFTVPAGMYPGDFRWSPDGRWLAFLLFEGNEPGLSETSALGLWVLDTVTMQGREGLSLPRPDAPKLTSASLIGWHPGGKTLLLSWYGGSPRRRHFQLVDVDSWQATELALGERARPIGWIQLQTGTR